MGMYGFLAAPNRTKQVALVANGLFQALWGETVYDELICQEERIRESGQKSEPF